MLVILRMNPNCSGKNHETLMVLAGGVPGVPDGRGRDHGQVSPGGILAQYGSLRHVLRWSWHAKQNRRDINRCAHAVGMTASLSPGRFAGRAGFRLHDRQANA
jgi:hypothetical protein